MTNRKMLWTTHRRRMGAQALIDSFRDGGQFTDVEDKTFTIKDFPVGSLVTLCHEATGAMAWYTITQQDLDP